MMIILLVTSAMMASAPAELISHKNESVSNLRIDAKAGQAAWDAVDDGRRVVRLANLAKGKMLRPPKSEGPQRSAGTIGKKSLVNAHDGERWAIEVKGKEPAAPSAASDVHARVSPDGTLLAFVSGRSGKGDLYVTPAKKTNQPPRRVADNAWPDLYPAWSPDSAQLAVVQTTPRGRKLSIFKGISGGGTIDKITVTDERIGPMSPSWRPDGKEIAFYARNWSSATMLYVATPGIGAPSQRISNVVPQASGPQWLQQGDKFYLIAVRYDGVVIAVDQMGSVTVLETGTFGNREVAVGIIAGKPTLLVTALGLSGAEGGNGLRKVYRWSVPKLD
ncbi:MAG: dipeptidyl aminopeptidase/acylaminoacyl peptidase [Myxococcota bacterium]|jgi:dipeptidyl aminopeptidase/acylaminoacyl peptidase